MSVQTTSREQEYDRGAELLTRSWSAFRTAFVQLLVGVPLAYFYWLAFSWRKTPDDWRQLLGAGSLKDWLILAVFVAVLVFCVWLLKEALRNLWESLKSRRKGLHMKGRGLFGTAVVLAIITAVLGLSANSAKDYYQKHPDRWVALVGHVQSLSGQLLRALGLRP